MIEALSSQAGGAWGLALAGTALLALVGCSWLDETWLLAHAQASAESRAAAIMVRMEVAPGFGGTTDASSLRRRAGRGTGIRADPFLRQDQELLAEPGREEAFRAHGEPGAREQRGDRRGAQARGHRPPEQRAAQAAGPGA